MANLSTTYLGFKLKNPLIVSASPLSGEIDNLRQMEEAGAAAVVLPSLFEEQIEIQDMGWDQFPQDQALLPQELQHIPNMQGYNQGASGYLAYVYQAKKAIHIPVIASLNGYYGGGWVRYGKIIEAAGADALELNIYYLPTKPQVNGAEVEQMYVDLVHHIKAEVKIPVAVKLGPYFTAMTNMAVRLDEAGANALVLFNRFYQPEFDIENETVEPHLDLSTSAELRLRLRWVAILREYIKADLVVTGGIHSAVDILKSVMAGADAAMMTSALYKHGIDHIRTVLANLHEWLDEHDCTVQQIHGRMSRQAIATPELFERANYMTLLRSLKKREE